MTTEQLKHTEKTHHVGDVAGLLPVYWSGVFAMALCIFALVASEFMPVSILTPMAADLSVSKGMAGQGITISGVFALITSLSISAIAGEMNRKTLLLGLTVLMGISGVVIALAPNFFVYMVGRALIGVVVGGFWSMSTAVAMRLVSIEQLPRALAIFNGGSALATVIAAPLGSYLGALMGWRSAFFCLVPVAVIVFIWQWVALPNMRAQGRTSDAGNVFKVIESKSIAFGVLACGTFFMGEFVLFTYLRPFLETVTQVSVSTLSMILLVIGASGIVGTIFVGSVIRRSLYAVLIIIPIVMAVIAVALIPLGEWVVAVFVLLALWGLMATSAPVGWWSWVAKVLPHKAEAAGGLLVAVVQLSIASGSGLGGVLFDAVGYWSTFVAAAVVLIISVVLAVSVWRLDTPKSV